MSVELAESKCDLRSAPKAPVCVRWSFRDRSQTVDSKSREISEWLKEHACKSESGDAHRVIPKHRISESFQRLPLTTCSLCEALIRLDSSPGSRRRYTVLHSLCFDLGRSPASLLRTRFDDRPAGSNQALTERADERDLFGAPTIVEARRARPARQTADPAGRCRKAARR